MLDLFRKQRGAVTVFLIIILVPSITICSLYVDVSRVELAKPVVQSAGQLALNTMLTDYDKELNEFYGLLGSCQNTEDVKAVTIDFFERTLKSQKVDKDSQDIIEQSVDNLLQGNSDNDIISDLLQIECADTKLEAVDNANLANSAIVKQQVVEFMKYRGPIDIGSSLLKSINQVVNNSKLKKNQAKVIDKQNDYYEAQSELYELLKKISDSLKLYQKIGITKDYITERQNKINGSYKTDYEKCHKKLVFDIMNTGGLSKFEPEDIKYKVSQYTDIDYGNDTKYSNELKASTGDVETRANDLVKACATYIEKKKSINTNIWRIIECNENIYRTQYWALSAIRIKDNNTIYDEYIAAAKEMCRAYWLFNNASQFSDNESAEINIDNYDEVYDLMGTNSKYAGPHTISYSKNTKKDDSVAAIFMKLQDDFKTNGFYYGEAYRLQVISNRATKSSDSIDIGGKGNGASTKIGTIDARGVDAKINEIYKDTSDYTNNLDEAYKYLHEQIIKDYLPKLGDRNSGLIQKTISAWEEWEKATQKLEEVAKEEKCEKDDDIVNNREELNQEKKLIDETLTSENIQEFKNRISNTSTLIKTALDNINSTKYNKTKISTIKNISDLKSKTNVTTAKVASQNANYDNLIKYSSESFKFEKGTREIKITNSNNPDLNEVNKTEIHKWMDNTFKDSKDVKNQDDKDLYDKYKNQSKDKDLVDLEGGNNSKNEIKGKNDLPSSGGDSEQNEKKVTVKSSSNKMEEMFSDSFLDKMKDVVTNFRDDLYTTDYIMNMFSYDTFVKEGVVNNKDKDMSEEDFKTNNDLTFKDNKTLTNKLISEENNYDFCGEIEYILYGNTNAINKANAYGRIFAIKYAFNLPPVFQYYWGNGGVIAAADAISAATLGVVPVPVIKAAICLALTLAETVSDIVALKSGKENLLIKTKDELTVSFSKKGGANGGTSKDVKDNSRALQYSDYLTLFVFLKLIGDGENIVYKRIADVIQCNMQLKDKSKEENIFLMKKAVVYYQLTSDISIKPMMLDLEINVNNVNRQINFLSQYEFKEIAGY